MILLYFIWWFDIYYNYNNKIYNDRLCNSLTASFLIPSTSAQSPQPNPWFYRLSGIQIISQHCPICVLNSIIKFITYISPYPHIRTNFKNLTITSTYINSILKITVTTGFNPWPIFYITLTNPSTYHTCKIVHLSTDYLCRLRWIIFNGTHSTYTTQCIDCEVYCQK